MTLRPTMMTLGELLRGLPTTRVVGSTATPIADIAYHSKAVRSGGLFVAIPGLQHDGHAFVSEAIARGAAAVVVQRPTEVPPGVTQVVVADSRIALASLSCAFFGEPSRAFSLIGITGTNGKGTTAYLLDAVLARARRRTGVVGTLGVKVGTQTTPLDRTTPEAPDLQRILRWMADQHLDNVLMEVASHALALHRVDGCRFRGAVFTNLTQDHLDFHKTLESYRDAKRTLFEMVDSDGNAAINADDPSASFMAAASRAPVVTYGITSRADVRAEGLRLHLGGSEFTAVTPHGRLRSEERRVGKECRSRWSPYH